MFSAITEQSNFIFDYKHLSHDDLELHFTKLVQTERKITHLVLECIAEIDSRKLYLERAYPSLFEYLVRGFGYSPSAAVRRIDSARLLREIPDLSQKLETGALNLSQISRVQRAVRATEKIQSRRIDTTEKLSILQKIEFSTQEHTESILSQELVLPIPQTEKKQNHRDESVTLTITFSKDQMNLLEQARDAISHCVPSRRWAEALAHLAKRELARRTRLQTKHNRSPPIRNFSYPAVTGD